MSTDANPLIDVCVERYPEFPGLWKDATGAVHFCIEEFHNAHGIPNDPASIEETREIAMEMIVRGMPGVRVTFRPHPPVYPLTTS